jgi:hypothetical protein
VAEAVWAAVSQSARRLRCASISVPSMECRAIEDGRNAGVAVIERRDLRCSRWCLKHRLREKRARCREQQT